MASESDAISTPTPEQEKLTDTFAPSQVQSPHESRQSYTGFLVRESRLPGFKPTPKPKKPYAAWIWQLGEPVTKNSNGETYWMCRICYKDSVKHPHDSFIFKADPTALAQRHMVHHGYNLKGNKLKYSEKRKNKDMKDLLEQQETANNTIFDDAGWRRCYIAWVVCDAISLRQATSKRHEDLLTFQHPRLQRCVSASHTTGHDWIIQYYRKNKDQVIKGTSSARSRITISFDGWKTANDLDLLAIIAHYLDEHLRLKTVLLGLRDTYGAQTGDTIAEELHNVLREYKLCNRIAYFAADNATNNDKALQTMAAVMPLDPKKQRLRCAGHITNLICKAILYGVDIDCIEDVPADRVDDDDAAAKEAEELELERSLQSKDEQARLQAWRKKGPIGKLHNLVIHIRNSPARRIFFESKQRESLNDSNKIYRIVLNGGIRWNSSCDMIERALKLRDALHLYQDHYCNVPAKEGPLVAEDCLISEDWLELTDLLHLLKPLKRMSLNVQSTALDGEHGALHEGLTTLDHLLTSLEDLKTAYTHLPASHFKASINLGWKKINKCCKLSDRTPV